MKKLLSLTLAILMMLSVVPLSALSVGAETVTSGITGDCTWKLDGTVLTIAGNGRMANYNNWYSVKPWPDTITEVVIEEGVSHIGDSSFRGCTKIENIIIPKSLKSAGQYAFYNSKIKNVKIEDLTAWCTTDFYYEDYWYDGDQEMLEGGVCYANPLTYAENLILDDKIVTDVKLPEGVTETGNGIFCGYKKLSTLILPESLVVIGNAAFEDCTSLTKVSMQNNVTKILENAFSGCKSLKDLQLSGNLKIVGMRAFMNCKALKNVWFGGDSKSKGEIEYLDVGNYDYSKYIGYKYLVEAIWHYNTCMEHTFDINGVCTFCKSNGKEKTLKKVNKKWYLYENDVRSYKTTLIKYNGKWFYVEKGVWNKNITTMIKYNGKWFYIINGKWNSAVNGVKYYRGKYFYVKNGKWDKTKTGFLKQKKYNRDYYYYIKNGKWDQNTQILKYKGTTYYIKNGIRTTYTGLLKYNGRWAYFKDGKWSKENAIVRYIPKKVKIKKGVYIRSYYLEGYKGELFYVNNGYAQLDFTGKVRVNGKTYNIKNGIVV